MNFLLQFGFCVIEPGVPYTVTVSASTAVGKGEPVSINIFAMQQGNIVDNIVMHSVHCDISN